MNFLNQYSGHAHWAPRIALASVFIYHGLQKLLNLQGSAEMMGFPVPIWTLVALAETFGGLFVLIGGFLPDIVTRLGAAMLIPVMLGAIFMVHLANGWNVMNGGAEFPVTLLLLSVYLVLKGNGINEPVQEAAA